MGAISSRPSRPTFLNIGKSTDLSVIREKPHKFLWGNIVKFHDVDVYTVVEFEPSNPDEADRLFAVYVNGVNTESYACTLEGAFLIAFGTKFRCPDAIAQAVEAGKVLRIPA